MARVLIVSRNPAMAMGLSATNYEVVDLRPQAFGAWIEGEEAAEALVLDLESPQLAVAAVTNLRAHAKLAPVLLVSSDRPGWDAPEVRRLAGAEVLPLPISRPALLSALEDLLRVSRAPHEHDALASKQHDDVAEALNELVMDRDDLLSEDDDLDRLITPPPQVAPVPAAPRRHAVSPSDDLANLRTESVPHSAVDARAQRDVLGPEPVEPIEQLEVTVHDLAEEHVDVADNSVYDHPPLSAIPRTRSSRPMPPSTYATSRDDIEALRPTAPTTSKPSNGHRRRTELAAMPDTSKPTSDADPIPEEAVALVRRLAAVTNALYGVPETAEVIVADAVDRTHAEGGALLVPDDGSWRVAAGVGLRPLEHRYELHADSWLVQQIAQAHKGAIIEESDIAREQLQGAPLASWRHLVAAPIPRAEALMVLARRENPPFDEDDLTMLAALGEEAGELLSAAMATRALARTLWEFRDEDDRRH